MKTKCDICNKKVLLIYTCKCNKNYCNKHHYPEDHNCTFNFKEEYKKKLIELNTIIKNNKLIKIE